MISQIWPTSAVEMGAVFYCLKWDFFSTVVQKQLVRVPWERVPKRKWVGEVFRAVFHGGCVAL